MDSSFLQLLSDFIAETEPLAEKVDELTKETASELYSMYDTAAKAATLNIRVIDPELRVMLCDKQDRILERIVDIDRSFERSGIQGIFTPAVQGYRRWVNVELLKDKCLTGYMLAKELDTRSTMMFCSKPADYPNKELLPSLEILYSDAEVNVKNLICNKIPYQLYRSLSAIREPGPVPGNPLKSTVGPNRDGITGRQHYYFINDSRLSRRGVSQEGQNQFIGLVTLKKSHICYTDNILFSHYIE